jgi:hypothetical protein
MISRRHRGTEKNATVSAMLVVYVRCEEAKVRWRFSGLFDRRGQACLNAIWLFQSMKFSPCLCVSVRAKSRARTSRCTRAGGNVGFQVEVKPARRVNLVGKQCESVSSRRDNVGVDATGSTITSSGILTGRLTPASLETPPGKPAAVAGRRLAGHVSWAALWLPFLAVSDTTFGLGGDWNGKESADAARRDHGGWKRHSVFGRRAGQHRPKQLLTLDGTRSLLQATLDRCQPWIPP